MPAVFDISPTTAGVQSVSGSVTVTITGAGASAGGWNATTNSDWITISPTSGENGEAVVSYSENEDTVARTGVVTFTNEMYGNKTLTITQEAASAPSGGNIFIGGEGISIMLGGDEIPAIYCGEELLYPINLGTLTGISITNLTWVTDVPYTGGTATKDNCTYKVIGHYNTGKDKTITSQATITGSIVASSTTSTTRTDLGLLVLTATYEGFTASGSVEAYQEANHYNQYMTFIITSPGKVVWYASNASKLTKTIQYSFDSGSTWTSITSAQDTNNGFDVVAGDVVMFKGENTAYGQPTGSSIGGSSYYNQFTNTTARFIAEGNIMSMFYGDNFAGNDTLPGTGHTFIGVFNGCTGMSDASNLILPATTMLPYCYRNLFSGCRLTTGVPKLPATTLAEGCYTNMFINCLTLETAPDLPARTLVKQCYDGMLYMQNEAHNLRYIKCLATNMTASNCLRNFKNASNISPTGVFVKYPGASWASGGNTGIPTGWTVIESTE